MSGRKSRAGDARGRQVNTRLESLDSPPRLGWGSVLSHGMAVVGGVRSRYSWSWAVIGAWRGQLKAQAMLREKLEGVGSRMAEILNNDGKSFDVTTGVQAQAERTSGGSPSASGGVVESTYPPLYKVTTRSLLETGAGSQP